MAWTETGIEAGTTAQMAVATVAGRPILVVHAEGRWWAVEDRCSHAACAFSSDGEVDGSTLICNCHGSEFDIRSGAATAPPARVPLETYPARVAHGRIEIDI